MRSAASRFDADDDDDEVVDCPQCGAEVYRLADCCPTCGYWFVDEDDITPEGRHRPRPVIVKLASVILVVSLIIGLLLAGIASMGG